MRRTISNCVLVTHAFDSRDDAEAFAANPELKEKMGQGGVDGSSVRIEYLDEVEMEDVGHGTSGIRPRAATSALATGS